MKTGLSDLLLKVGKLKSLKRTGWVREGMPDPESVAEHTFRVCLLVLLLGNELKVDTNKLLKMALVHDLEEAESQDPVTQRGATNTGEHNHAKEKEIVERLLAEASNKEEILKFWEAHLPQNSPGAPREASVLYQLGKLATCWQALEYELGGAETTKLNEFWENAKTHVADPVLVNLLKEMEAKRKNG